MTKRILAVLICLVLAFALLPKVAHAANATAVTVAGVSLAADTYYLNDTANNTIKTGGSSTNYNVHWDATAGVLRLNNLRFNYEFGNPGAETYGIHANGDITLELHGASGISAIHNNLGGSATGLRVHDGFSGGNLTITGVGGGGLAVTGDPNGVDVNGNLSVTSGSLTGRSIGRSGAGVTANRIDITGDGGLVGESSGSGAYDGRYESSYGVTANTSITVSGNGRLEGHSRDNHERVKGAGISVRDTGPITVNGGTLLATAFRDQWNNNRALLGSLTLGAGISAAGSANTNGANPVPYVAANNDTYRWVKAPETVAPGGGEAGGETGAAVPQTGDDTPLMLLFGIALLCGVGLTARRRKA